MTDAAHAPEPPAGADDLLFVGTATTLITVGGLTVLTDPNFLHQGQRAYLGKGLWSTRLTEPALSIDELPPVDVVVLSHLHGDHFDRVARHGLDKALPIVTTTHAAPRLRRYGFLGALGLDTWQVATVERDGVRLQITAMPGIHAPGPLRALLPPVMGSLLEFSVADRLVLRLYVTGDTLLGEHVEEIARRHPDIDVGVLHLGGTKVLGVTVTMDARMGADLVEQVRPAVAVPIHYDDYGVFRSPLSDFLAEADRRGLGGSVRPVRRGERLPLPVRTGGAAPMGGTAGTVAQAGDGAGARRPATVLAPPQPGTDLRSRLLSPAVLLPLAVLAGVAAYRLRRRRSSRPEPSPAVRHEPAPATRPEPSPAVRPEPTPAGLP